MTPEKLHSIRDGAKAALELCQVPDRATDQNLQGLAENVLALVVEVGRLTRNQGVTLNALQLSEAVAFVAPDGLGDKDQEETEIGIQWLPERPNVEGGTLAAGYYCWLDEYPEEGCYGPLNGKGLLLRKQKVITLCGSSRFVAESAVKAWEFNKQGIATFFMPMLPQWYPGVQEHHQAEAEGVAKNLDDLWLELIRMADEIFVVNCGGYIGERTRVEIRHAQALGKPVRYLEPLEVCGCGHPKSDHRVCGCLAFECSCAAFNPTEEEKP